MTISRNDLTPQERLAITRKAILRHMNRLRPQELGHDVDHDDEDDDELNQDPTLDRPSQGKFSRRAFRCRLEILRTSQCTDFNAGFF